MIKKLYKRSPVLLQNIFVTIENIFVLYKKYKYIPLLDSMAKISQDVVKNSYMNKQHTLLDRINKFSEYATSHTVYYKSKKNEYPKLNSLDEITKWPLLEKEVLKAETETFYSSEIDSSNSRTLHTSGSTGSPMKIKVSVSDLQLRFRLLLKTMIEFGYDPLKPMGRITGHDISDEDVIYRKDYLNKHFFLSAFHLSQDNIQKYYDVIVDNQLETLEGYPSAIYVMAKLFDQNGYKVECVKNVFTTAEKLHEYQKEQIEKTFGCKVFDYYGSNEQSIFIFTCKEGRLHSADATGLLEVVDEDSRHVQPGEVGSMVVTSLTSHFMPLIRYKIGDACKLSEDQSCGCGNGGLIIDEIIGRDEDIFQTIEGNYITRFSVVLKYLPFDVIESQIVLNNEKLLIVLYYVANKMLIEDLFSDFEKNLISKVGTQYHIVYKKVDEITKTSRGKKRAVIIED
ncbi:MAG TPA: phenylacetate--CoA ligase family protein [Arcobacter sp.]|nr:phenylacetate--CoA ligase family protein [Arcobacter sp.]